MERLSGAQIIVRLLERQGVSIVAGIPGGGNLPLYDALSDSQAIRHVLARHEQGAGFIAQGMARVSGRPEVFLATSGPGVTNALTAIADAKLDSVPIICITGQVPSGLIGTDAFQEVDAYGLSIPITKHNFLVRSVEELLRVIPDAFRIAASGRPGPVLIDVPKDVQTQCMDVAAWPEPGRADAPPALDAATLDAAAALINQAKRPVLFLGGGVIASGAAPAALALAEKASLPTAMTLMGLGAMPTTHPLALGMLGMHAPRFVNMALAECDLLIAAGARFDDRATGKVAAFCPDAKIIHIDIDAGELDKIKSAHVGIIGDVADVLGRLSPLVERAGREAWRERIAALKKDQPMRFPDSANPRSPYGIVLETARRVAADTIITTDVGQHQMRTAQAYPFRMPRRWLTSGGLGTMGFGLPAAIGASLADPAAKVVCFSGDGSIMMNIQELATAVETGVNVAIIVSDNGGLGLVRQQQQLFYNNRLFASDYQHTVDYVRIAEGFGMPAFDLGRADDPGALLALALAHRGPCLVRAPMESLAHVYPMVPPGAANTEMIGGESHVLA
ncbi:MAG: acetolactate synthase large subunit [Desulfovibrionaceae bacterium]